MNDQQDKEQVEPAMQQDVVAAPTPAVQPPQPPRRPGCAALGYCLIIVGLLLLCHNMGWIGLIDFRLWWPVLLMIIGLSLIMRKLRR